MVVVEHTMDVSGWLRKQLEQASPDLLRAMVREMAEALRGGEADEFCGAAYGERSPERVNRRDGYRERGWDTRWARSSLPCRSSGRAATSPTGCCSRGGGPSRRSCR